MVDPLVPSPGPDPVVLLAVHRVEDDIRDPLEVL
jgi:hypothetical protein